MNIDVQIALRTPTVTYDSYGQPVEAWTSTTVWATKQSATRSEFYAALASKIEVALTFEMRVEEYSGQTNITYDGVEYQLVRSYQKDTERVVLVVSSKKVN